MKKSYLKHGLSQLPPFLKKISMVIYQLFVCNTLEFLYCVQYRLSEGIWTDEDIRDAIGRMIELLNKTSNRARVHRWG